jgi:2-polyprenyl-3-methyl-5-hydroxy-6-metoxy-1,4-benzoquinol methylase
MKGGLMGGEVDAGRTSDWGRVSGDDTAPRPGPPDAHYDDRPEACEIAFDGALVLDIGTGVGEVARAMAVRGASLAPVDADTFDAAHVQMVTDMLPERFDALQRVRARIVERIR